MSESTPYLATAADSISASRQVSWILLQTVDSVGIQFKYGTRPLDAKVALSPTGLLPYFAMRVENHAKDALGIDFGAKYIEDRESVGGFRLELSRDFPVSIQAMFMVDMLLEDAGLGYIDLENFKRDPREIRVVNCRSWVEYCAKIESTAKLAQLNPGIGQQMIWIERSLNAAVEMDQVTNLAESLPRRLGGKGNANGVLSVSQSKS